MLPRLHKIHDISRPTRETPPVRGRDYVGTGKRAQEDPQALGEPGHKLRRYQPIADSPLHRTGLKARSAEIQPSSSSICGRQLTPEMSGTRISFLRGHPKFALGAGKDA